MLTSSQQTPADTDPLLPPRATAESIASQEGYGSLTMSTADAGGLSGKQRKRLADIGREVGK
jgi:hypothetical protein